MCKVIRRLKIITQPHEIPIINLLYFHYFHRHYETVLKHYLGSNYLCTLKLK